MTLVGYIRRISCECVDEIWPEYTWSTCIWLFMIFTYGVYHYKNSVLLSVLVYKKVQHVRNQCIMKNVYITCSKLFCLGHIIVRCDNLIDLPIPFLIANFKQNQPYDWSGASQVTLKNIGKICRSVVPEAGTKGRDKWLHLTLSVRCNYLFLPLIPASGTALLILYHITY